MRRLLPRRSRSAGWNGWDTSHACLSKDTKVCTVWLAAPETPQVWPKEKMEGCDQEGLEGYRSEGG